MSRGVIFLRSASIFKHYVDELRNVSRLAGCDTVAREISKIIQSHNIYLH
jgi:hypothetical protein